MWTLTDLMIGVSGLCATLQLGINIEEIPLSTLYSFSKRNQEKDVKNWMCCKINVAVMYNIILTTLITG